MKRKTISFQKTVPNKNSFHRTAVVNCIHVSAKSQYHKLDQSMYLRIHIMVGINTGKYYCYELIPVYRYTNK